MACGLFVSEVRHESYGRRDGVNQKSESKSFPSSKLESHAVIRGNQDQPGAGKQKE
jgi:hypothetical protein